MQTKSFSKRICDAEWSPTREGVFFIAKSDGSVDIWDLLDRTHAPILTQSISIHKLTFISFPNKKLDEKKSQLIAIGDSVGTLHIMEVPWSLKRRVNGEYQAVKAYLSREADRREYVKKRWDFREEEKRELERQAALKAGVINHFYLNKFLKLFFYYDSLVHPISPLKTKLHSGFVANTMSIYNLRLLS